jgi:hypothetical protein
MEIAHREQHGFRWPSTPGRKQVVLCALLIGLLPGPLFAQYNHEWYKTQVPPYRITAICRRLESQNRATCMIAAVFGAEKEISVSTTATREELLCGLCWAAFNTGSDDRTSR